MSPVLRPLVMKVAFASAILYAITATVEMTVPAHLSTTEVAWLVKPWLGAYIHTFPPSSLPMAALSVGTAGIVLVLIAFYLDHCVIDQPLWAIVGGWAPMLSGLALGHLQSAFGAWWVTVDINHSGFQLAYCEFVVGAGVVALSWLVAPELLNPRLGRLWVAAIIGGFLVAGFAQSALNAPEVLVDLIFGIAVVAGILAGGAVPKRGSTDRTSGVPVDT